MPAPARQPVEQPNEAATSEGAFARQVASQGTRLQPGHHAPSNVMFEPGEDGVEAA
jgi:hypothetical protein